MFVSTVCLRIILGIVNFVGNLVQRLASRSFARFQQFLQSCQAIRSLKHSRHVAIQAVLAVFLAGAAQAQVDLVVNVNDSGSDPTPAGGTIVYNVSIENDSLDDTSDPTTFVFNVPANATMTGATGALSNCVPTLDGDGMLPTTGVDTVTCDVMSLAPGQLVAATVELVPENAGSLTF